MFAQAKTSLSLSSAQSLGSRFLYDHESAALFWDVGVGKTLAVLSAIAPNERVIVFGPRHVIENVWPAEIAKWGFNFTYAACTRSLARRQLALNMNADITGVNYDNMVWFLDNTQGEYNICVLDELSKMKAPGTQRFKKFKRARKRFGAVWGLTGSPAANHLLNVWAQMECLEPGILGRTYTGFKRGNFHSIDYDERIWEPNEDTREWVEKRIAPYVHRAPREPGVDLMINDISLPVNKEAGAMVKELSATMTWGDMIVDNAAVLINKLIQVASGAMYTEESGPWTWVHNDKIDALGDLIEEQQGQPMIVFYNYRHEYERLLQSFPQVRGLDIDAWNSGQIEVMALHPASAGHGLNLQYGGHACVFFSLPWSLELYEQSIGRLRRQGQEHTVMVHRVLMGVDHDVAAALDAKELNQARLLEALK